MTSYIGPIGGLVAFKCPSSLVSSMSRPSAERVTTSGVVNVQVGPRTRREWSVDWSVARPSEVANLAALVAGEFGFGPFWFVDPWAQVTNLLAPGPSTLEVLAIAGVSAGGPVDLADGTRAGRSMVIENPAAFTVFPVLNPTTFHHVPVVQGRMVTGSTYATGAGVVQIRLQWYNAAGTQLSSSTFASFTPGSAMRRIHRTAMPPANAASVMIAVTGASRVARPAITWTDKLVDWHVGQGASSVAIPADLSQNILLAHTGSNGRLASVSTAIREIG